IRTRSRLRPQGEGLPGSLSASLLSLLPDITDPVDGPDPLRIFRILLKFCPDPSDIYGERILIHKLSLAVPHMGEDLFFGKHPVPVLHKIQKQLVFDPAERDLTALPCDSAGVPVNE